MSLTANRTLPPTLMNGICRFCCRRRTPDTEIFNSFATSIMDNNSRARLEPIGALSKSSTGPSGLPRFCSVGKSVVHCRIFSLFLAVIPRIVSNACFLYLCPRRVLETTGKAVRRFLRFAAFPHPALRSRLWFPTVGGGYIWFCLRGSYQVRARTC